jgi:hypothetical protein
MADVQSTQTDKLNFDNIVKELLEESPEENIIQCINTLYKTDFPLDSKVTRLPTETNTQGEQRRSDVMLAINGQTFHLEAQSSPGADMVFRVFNYGYRHAISNRNKNSLSDTLELTFPDPIVIHLQSKKKVPEKYTIKLNFTSTESFSHQIPAKKIGDFTPEGIIKGSLYAIGAFYPLKYEKELSEENADDVTAKLETEIEQLLKWVDEKVENNEISKEYATLFANGLTKVMSRIKLEAKITNKEALEKIMENIQTQKYVLDPLNWKAQGKVEGKAEGDAERQRETARRMKRKNYPIEAILELTDLSYDDVVAMQT